MSKFVEERIEAAKKVMEEINVMVNNNPDCVKYLELRSQLNLELIQAVIGGKIVSKVTRKNGTINKICYTEKLPTVSELSEICMLLREFAHNTEDPFIYAWKKKMKDVTDEEDDMSIDVTTTVPMIDDVTFVIADKINTKKMNEMIIGSENVAGISTTSRITDTNIMQLAANAVKLRKHQNRNKLFTIAGITLLAVGSTAVAVSLYNKKHKKLDNVTDDSSVDMDESIDMNMDIDDTIDMDTPVVSIDE